MTEMSQAEKVEYWTKDYNFWAASIRGEKPPIYNEGVCLGFYRKGITERNAAGNSKRVGWEPVAVFMDGRVMTARIGNAETGRDVTGDAISELWSYIAKNPITEEMYDSVARRGEAWSDDHKSRKPAAEASPAEVAPSEPQTTDETPDSKIAREIAEQRAYLPEFATIESDEQSGRARSLQTEFLAIKKRAADAYEEANRPLLTAQKALREVWFPLRDDADDEAKKIGKALGAWEDVKRIAAKRIQEEHDRLAFEHAKAIRDAEAANAPPPPPPVAPTPNVPPPASQIRGGTGRAASVKVEKFVTEIDAEKVFQSFKTNAEVIALLTCLAQKAIRAGVDVPGAIVKERSVVK